MPGMPLLADGHPHEPDHAARLVVGSRVAVRTRLSSTPGPLPYAGPTLTDTVGELLSMDERALVVRTRSGDVRLERARVVAARVVPPRPTRRGAAHRAISIADLQRAMVAGHPPLEDGRVGDWLLRAADGWTGRSNSLLPVGDPGLPLEEALDRASAWYTERDLPLRVQLAAPPRARLEDDPLARVLLERGAGTSDPVHVMTAATRTVMSRTADAALPPGLALVVETTPTPAFLAASGERVRGHAQVAAAVWGRSAASTFLRVEDTAGATVGVARTPTHDGWAGLYGLHTEPASREAGIGTALVGEVARRADVRGIRSLYLQVEQANPAIGLYTRLGFETHHVYRYLSLPR